MSDLQTEARAELEAARTQLRDAGRKRWDDVARMSGVPFDTVRKFAYGTVENPGYTTVVAIRAAVIRLAEMAA